MQYILNFTFRSRYTIYCGGSLVEKIITRVYLVMQSAVFGHYNLSHVILTQLTIN